MAGANADAQRAAGQGQPHRRAASSGSGAQAYLLQNNDKRVIFVNPYEGDLALIGTTDIPYEGRPEDVAADASEIDYLLEVVNRYFAPPTDAGDIVCTASPACVRSMTTMPTTRPR